MCAYVHSSLGVCAHVGWLTYVGRSEHMSEHVCMHTHAP